MSKWDTMEHAELVQKCYLLASMAEQAETRVADLANQLNCSEGEYQNLKNKCNRLETRIAELEESNKFMSDRLFSIANRDIDIKITENQIKAEGIREMINTIDCLEWWRETKTFFIEDVLEYADKLEKGNE